jgi:Anaphase promoting complex subunit 8 / Cdc23
MASGMASGDISMDTTPTELTQQQTQELYYGLMNAVKSCSERGMYSSAKWYTPPTVDRRDVRAAEMLNSMDSERTKGLLSPPEQFRNLRHFQDETNERTEMPKYMLAKTYFDCKEYDRATFVLAPCQSVKSIFLRLYSKYLVRTSMRKTDVGRGKAQRRGKWAGVRYDVYATLTQALRIYSGSLMRKSLIS